MQTQPANNPNHIPNCDQSNQINPPKPRQIAKSAADERINSGHALPISQRLHSHRAEAIELLNFDMVGSRCFFGDIRSSSHLLSTLLSHLPGLQRLLIRIELRLVPHVDLFLLRGRIDVVHFSVVLHG